MSRLVGLQAPDFTATAVVDQEFKEVTLSSYRGNNLPVGRSVDETLRLLQAFQYVQSHPDEVCPANWTPGEKTMNPDPVKSKEFFAAVN